MQISNNVETRMCAICGRSLLTGERPVRYAPTMRPVRSESTVSSMLAAVAEV